MKLKKWMNIVLVGCGIATLAACSSSHKNQDQLAVNDANSAYGAQASGVDDGDNFGDRAGGKVLAKRVYHFDFDSNVIRSDDKPAIDANGTYIASRQSAKVMLEGHTDPRGSREYNVGLGERRAKAVAQALDTKGVNPSQVRVVSYGAEKLAAPGHTEEDYQKDRRVALVYLKR